MRNGILISLYSLALAAGVACARQDPQPQDIKDKPGITVTPAQPDNKDKSSITVNPAPTQTPSVTIRPAGQRLRLPELRLLHELRGPAAEGPAARNWFEGGRLRQLQLRLPHLGLRGMDALDVQ